MTFFQRFYVGIASVVCLLLLVLLHALDLPYGPPRFLGFLGVAAVFALIIWLGNRQQSRP